MIVAGILLDITHSGEEFENVELIFFKGEKNEEGFYTRTDKVAVLFVPLSEEGNWKLGEEYFLMASPTT